MPASEPRGPGLLRRLLVPRKDPARPPRHGVALPRNMLASVLASSVEAAGIPALVELGGVHYLYAVLGCMLVAMTLSFLLNKYWVFEARRGKAHFQYARQLAVSAGTYGANAALIWALTDHLGQHYMLAWACSNLVVFFCWSYPGGRWIVFADGHRASGRPATPDGP